LTDDDIERLEHRASEQGVLMAENLGMITRQYRQHIKVKQ